jgi:hypothetical protein
MSDDAHVPSLPSTPPPLPQVPPAPSAVDAWSYGAPSPKKRRTGLVVGAILAALAVVAGVVGFTVLSGDKESASARPLALAFTPGQSQTYTMHMTMDGQLTAGELLGGDQPLRMDVTQSVTWKVTSVDEQGTATIEVTVNEMSGTLNGTEIPAETFATPPIDIQVAADGRVLSAGGMSLSGLGQTGGASFPGMDQMTPLLPGHPVAPGDTWTKDFSQDIPFGEGKIEFTATSTLDRYEDVDGVNAAVVTTRYTVPMDFTIDFDQLLATMGGSTAGTDLGAFENASIAYGGQGTFRQTSWIDVDAKKMLKTSSSGSFDMTMAFEGLDAFEGQSIGFQGDFTQELEVS